MRKLLSNLVKFLALAAWLAVVASALGRLHPLGDSLAVIRVPLLVMAALAVIWTDWSRLIRWPLAGVALVLLSWHIWARVDRATQDYDFVLYQQNLLFDRSETADFLDQLAEVAPDFVTLQEVSTVNLPIMQALAEDLPTQHHCPITPWLGEAVLSRHPMVPGTAFCSQPDGLAGMQVVTPLGPVWLVSVHLRWPWPYTQAAQVEGLLPQLAALEGPVIMAGDFNAVAWSHTVRLMARASGTARAGAHVHSFARLPVPIHLGIDHVLTSWPAGAQSVTQMPLLGSDHFGILAYLSWPSDE